MSTIKTVLTPEIIAEAFGGKLAPNKKVMVDSMQLFGLMIFVAGTAEALVEQGTFKVAGHALATTALVALATVE